jgi:5-formyltetrahydrofolate cyclo-ligase
VDAGADASDSSALRRAKQSLRGRVLAARDDLVPQVRIAGALAIRDRLKALPSFGQARCVLVTLPFRSEWDTRPLADEVLREGRRVAVPRVDREARTLHLHAIEDIDRDIVPGYLGVPEPRPTLPTVDPGDVDWVLVPGVAFDAQGRRLGYGGGFFDRLLPLVPAEAPKIAGAFDVQIVDEVPVGPFDHRIDAIATPTALLGNAR